MNVYLSLQFFLNTYLFNGRPTSTSSIRIFFIYGNGRTFLYIYSLEFWCLCERIWASYKFAIFPQPSLCGKYRKLSRISKGKPSAAVWSFLIWNHQRGNLIKTDGYVGASAYQLPTAAHFFYPPYMWGVSCNSGRKYGSER